MFVLAEMQDTVRVAPGAFGKPTTDIVKAEVDAKYAARVVNDVGLCVCCRDVLDVGDGLVYPLDGGATYKATFSLLVFRPFVGEIVTATIVASGPDGVRASLGFFEDVNIPSKFLPTPAYYDKDSNIWTWRPDLGDDEDGGGGDDACFHLDVGLELRFRVAAINFTRVSKHKRGLQATTSTIEVPGASAVAAPGNVRQRSSSVDLDASAPLPSAMEITGSINEDGLGPTTWWPDDEPMDET